MLGSGFAGGARAQIMFPNLYFSDRRAQKSVVQIWEEFIDAKVGGPERSQPISGGRSERREKSETRTFER